MVYDPDHDNCVVIPSYEFFLGKRVATFSFGESSTSDFGWGDRETL